MCYYVARYGDLCWRKIDITVATENSSTNIRLSNLECDQFSSTGLSRFLRNNNRSKSLYVGFFLCALLTFEPASPPGLRSLPLAPRDLLPSHGLCGSLSLESISSHSEATAPVDRRHVSVYSGEIRGYSPYCLFLSLRFDLCPSLHNLDWLLQFHCVQRSAFDTFDCSDILSVHY